MERKTTLNQHRWTAAERKEAEEQLKKQLSYLNFNSLEAYYAWCDQNKRKKTLDKKHYQLEEERNLRLEQLALEEEKRRKYNIAKKGKSSEVMSIIDDIEKILKTNSHLVEPWKEITQLRYHCVYTSSTFIDRNKSKHNHFIYAYFRLAAFSELFKISPLKLKIKKSNPTSYFQEAVNQLISKYPLPKAFLEWWFSPEDRKIQAYVDLVQGKKVYPIFKEVETIPLTHRQINLILNKFGKESFSYDKARLQAILHSLTAPAGLISALTREVEFLSGLNLAYELKLEFIQYLIKNATFFNWQKTKELWDYVYELRRVSVNPATFSLKNRNMANLLEGMETWHTGLAKKGLATKDSRIWEKSHIKNYEHTIETTGETIKIEELLTGKEIYQEGKLMHHCVYSYASRCENGQTAIFSLSHALNKSSTLEKAATIEVNLQTGMIVQFKAKYNAAPSAKAYNHMHRWSDANNLRTRV